MRLLSRRLLTLLAATAALAVLATSPAHPRGALADGICPGSTNWDNATQSCH
jgi:hypothetical protein